MTARRIGLASALALSVLCSAAAESEIAKANSEWLEHNAQNDGVVVMPSGLQYKVLNSGPKDGARAGAGDYCTCHYDGSLIDGTSFDSSRKRGKPAKFKPSGVIPGWTEALQLMRPGDRWMLYIPAALGYGARGAGGKIPGGATLVFDLELISVAPSAGLFAGTNFDMDLIGPIKLWHAFAMVVVWFVYNLMTGGFGGGGGKKVSASHILVKEEALCAELKTKINSPAEFAGLAKAHSCAMDRSNARMCMSRRAHASPCPIACSQDVPVGQAGRRPRHIWTGPDGARLRQGLLVGARRNGAGAGADAVWLSLDPRDGAVGWRGQGEGQVMERHPRSGERDADEPDE